MGSDRETRVSHDVHVWPVRVYYEDTDATGFVYHASYLRFAERARTELARTLGLENSRLMAAQSQPVILPVRRLEVEYHAGARLDDALEVRTHLAAVGGASLTFDQMVVREGLVVARVKVLVACVHRGSGCPVRWPPAMRDRLDAYITRKDQERPEETRREQHGA
ncbi:MAG: acyl-CoA thioester hydrolase [Rhodospirillaceae bacterium]|nr:MAG: acyl-CoA thioester hydrolase [Rhodospirillaceae bacterium]